MLRAIAQGQIQLAQMDPLRLCEAPYREEADQVPGVTKEVCSYHWEVVDGCGCDCGDGCDSSCDCIFKPAPTDARIGAVLELTDEELRRFVNRSDEAAQDADARLVSHVTTDR